ncbi:MAG: hypothetical protein ACO4AU_09550 [bacterium]|jgi:hypothetical protein
MSSENQPTEEFVRKALQTTLYLSLLIATIDWVLYVTLGSAVLTVLLKAHSLWVYLRYRLQIDTLKMLELSALAADVVLLVEHGYAVVSPIFTLVSIVLVITFKEQFVVRYRRDLEQLLSQRNS